MSTPRKVKSVLATTENGVKSYRFAGTIIVDTREQNPYQFGNMIADAADGGERFMVPYERGTLKSGDYSLLGYETAVAVERKSIADLFGTLGQGRDRFERELERLACYKFAAVVVESTFPDVLLNPPPHSDLNPKTISRSVIAWQQRYPAVHWWFAGPRGLAEAVTFRILERFLKERLTEASQIQE